MYVESNDSGSIKQINCLVIHIAGSCRSISRKSSSRVGYIGTPTLQLTETDLRSSECTSLNAHHISSGRVTAQSSKSS